MAEPIGPVNDLCGFYHNNIDMAVKMRFGKILVVFAMILLGVQSCALLAPHTGSINGTVDFDGFDKYTVEVDRSPSVASFSTCLMNDLRYLEPQNYKREDLLGEIYSWCDQSPALGQLLYIVDTKPTHSAFPRVVAIAKVVEVDRGDARPYMTRFAVYKGDAVAVLGYGQFRSRLIFASSAAARAAGR